MKAMNNDRLTIPTACNTVTHLIISIYICGVQRAVGVLADQNRNGLIIGWKSHIIDENSVGAVC